VNAAAPGPAHRLLPALLILAGAAIPAVFAQEPPVPACPAPEARQFDFWIGHWTVTTPEGAVAGDSRIESILEGCAVLEHWTGAKGGRGKSLKAWNATHRAWEQFWVDKDGQRLLLRGGLREGSMVLESVDEGVAGARRERIRWTPAADGSVRQLWEASTDGGATWSVEFDGRYTRVLDVDRAE
jgi:hypothetical protein